VRRMHADSIWPEPSGSAVAPEVAGRWEALLDRAPRLRPWVDEMLGRRRLRLQQSGVAQIEVERTLWQELSRWLREFEELPEFAVSAIAVTLEDEALHEVTPDGGDPSEPSPAASPEQAVLDLETLLSDATFALAFHCVDACVRPRLPDSSELRDVPEADWFALLHASARPQPALSAEVAVALVLHALSPGWARRPAPCRHAALRLFLADSGDLRGDLQRLCAALPDGWGLQTVHLPAFVAAAGHARLAFAEASRLCGRFVSSLKARPGGLALLTDRPAGPASPEELGALFRNACKYGEVGGFRKLLSLL
jgi:hypothetical protein